MTCALGRLRGIRIEIHLSWLLLFGATACGIGSVIARSMTVATAAVVAASVCGALLIGASVLAHELAHALVARRWGIATRTITLFAFGGVARIECEPPTPQAEIAIALAGPLASFVLALLAGAVSFGLALPGAAATDVAASVAELIALFNALLGAFNLIPAFPMDGGRILRAIVWQTRKSHASATMVASLSGVGLGTIVTVAALVMLATTHAWPFAWNALVGAFVLRLAWANYAAARVSVRSVAP